MNNAPQHCQGWFNFATRTRAAIAYALFLSAWGFALQAQAAPRFQHLTTEDGLPQAVVHAINQDQQGFIWVATQSGVARYDGYQFNTFRHDPADPASISQDWVQQISTDNEGNLWFATDNAGICRTSNSTGMFHCLRHEPDNPKGLASNKIQALAAGSGESLYVGSKGGLNRVAVDTNEITTLFIPALGTNANINHLLFDTQQHLWIVANDRRLLRYNTVSGEVQDFSAQTADKPVAALAEDAAGDIWVASDHGELFRLTHTVSGDQKLPDRRLTSDYRFTSLLIDKVGTIWVGTYSNGLLKFDPRSNTFTQYQHSDLGNHGISSNHIVSLFQDEGEVIWIGTFHGINKWNPNLDNFTTYRQRRSRSNSNYVTAFAQQDANQLWVGSHNGLSRVDLGTGLIEQISTAKDPIRGLNDHRIFALQFDQQGGLWIGTMVGGLNYLAPAANRITQPFAEHQGAVPTGVTSLLVDRTGTLWIGTFASGLFAYDNNRKTLVQYLPGDGGNSISSASILSLLEDTDGNVWIGTNGDGLNHLDPTTRSFTSIATATGDPNSLSSNVIYALHQDTRGDLWIGTDQSGINRWRKTDQLANRTIFQRYSRAQGLPDATVHAILSEATGIVWFSTNAGLVRLDPYSDNITSFTSTHGLQDNEFNFAAALKTLNNTMVFGGINGFNVFDPLTIATNPHPPKIALTRFTRGHHDNLLPELANQRADAEHSLELEHTDVLISFEFAALDFTDPRKNQYQHRLLGFDNNWSNVSSTRQASFTNLVPGDYQFQVRAANSDGVWSARRLNVPFTMLAAPWNTPLARGLYAAFAALLLLAIYLNMRQLQSNAAAIRNKNQTLRTEIELRRAQERALVAEKQINQQYLDIVEVMILVLEDDGEIVRLNQKGERILGYHQDELLGHNFYDLLIPKESHPSVREHFSGMESFSYFESPIKTRNGDLRTIAWHTTRTSSKLPGAARIITSGMDMTQLRELERRMSEAQKMEALGNLARGIAHDFNNILSSIMGYTELSLDDLPSTSPVTTNLKRLEASARRARELVDSILTFSRHEQHGPEEVAPAAVLQEALQLIEPILPNDIELNLEVTTPDALVLANPTQLLQLITNLCTNAHQAMEQGGGILQVRLDTLVIGSPEPQLSANSNVEAPVEPGEYVRLVVSDTGHGMSAEVQQRIFDPFFSTKSKSQGTGLGLSVVHGIVRQLGGAIRVNSEIGKGSTFTTLLPLSTGEIAERPNQTLQVTSRVSVPRGSERILFVDDDLGVANIAEQLLSRSGYLVTLAYNGEQALAELTADRNKYDLLITDESMPRMTGTDLIRELRNLNISLPVILISGGGADRSSEEVHCYLQKPYTQQELAEAIRQVIDNEPGAVIDNPGVA